MGLWEVSILAHVILIFAYYFAVSKGKSKGSLICLTPLDQCGQEGEENRVTKGPGAGGEGVAGAYGACQSGWGLDASTLSVVTGETFG